MTIELQREAAALIVKKRHAELHGVIQEQYNALPGDALLTVASAYATRVNAAVEAYRQAREYQRSLGGVACKDPGALYYLARDHSWVGRTASGEPISLHSDARPALFNGEEVAAMHAKNSRGLYILPQEMYTDGTSTRDAWRQCVARDTL